jgi:putative FmdB family regulatory protein
MQYGYVCSECGTGTEVDFPMGKAERTVKCACGAKAKRVFTNAGFILKGGYWPSKNMKFNREMTEKNEKAGERMRANKPPLTLAAHDYGGGDVREVAK